jgi:hypothetical protein
MSQDDGPRQSNWRRLAEEAAQETDPEKLMRIIRMLCNELDAVHERVTPPGEQREKDSA